VESRSFSKTSAPSNPAAAIALSLVSSVPLIETVAIEVFIANAPGFLAGFGRSMAAAYHAPAVDKSQNDGN
jgi:hypothetical protein